MSRLYSKFTCALSQAEGQQWSAPSPQPPMLNLMMCLLQRYRPTLQQVAGGDTPYNFHNAISRQLKFASDLLIVLCSNNAFTAIPFDIAITQCHDVILSGEETDAQHRHAGYKKSYFACEFDLQMN
jgi:hypothetical protein